MTQTLLIVDIQVDYFAGGAFPLPGAEAAAERAAALLSRQREQGGAVVHVRHAGDPDDPYLAGSTPGAEIHPSVAPVAGEPVVVKALPNAFVGTDLRDVLQSLAADDLLVVGMMSSMCVDATVRAAADLGYQVTVAADACAAPALEFDGTPIDARAVHGAFMAALADAYARVVPTDQLLT